MANSVDPDQTVPIGAVCSGSTLFASILNSSVMLGNKVAADDFSRRHFHMHFFLGALRVKVVGNFVKKNMMKSKHTYKKEQKHKRAKMTLNRAKVLS